MNRRAQIVELLQQVRLSLDDDDIAGRLGMNRHYVNQICRQLAAERWTVRVRGSAGKLLNTWIADDEDVPLQGPQAPESSRPQSERMKRRDRARRNVDLVIDHFADCLQWFEKSNVFSGPSLYFHERAIERRRYHQSAALLLADERFLEYVYAVLPAWGMHRMGRQKAKVGDFADMVRSLQAASLAIEELWPLRITEVTPEDADSVARRVWDVIASLKVSTSETKIVAGSKTLHHVLPDLVSPIDRQYTFQFFTGQKQASIGEKRAFLEWFLYFAEIGRICRAEIADAIARNGFMATGLAKVVDNAIVGFMLRSNSLLVDGT
jgi:hypothetical protein